MKEIPSSSEIAVVSGDFEAFSPEEAYEYFTQAELLTKWWPKVAEVDLKVGGSYCLSWPANHWNLRGEYLVLKPGKHLGFSWAWDHEPSRDAAKTVDIYFEPLFENGSRVAIFHGPFDRTEVDQGARKGIIEGWIHFGMNLAGLRDGFAD